MAVATLVYVFGPCFAALLMFASCFLAARVALSPRGVSLSSEYRAGTKSADSAKTIIQAVVGALVCAVVAYGVTGKVIFSLMATPGGFYLAQVFRQRRAAARFELLCSQYAQVLTSLSSGLQGGLSLLQAIGDAVPSMPEPAREVFAEILRRVYLGDSIERAVRSVAEETGWKDLNSLAVAAALYYRTGCNLVEVFNHLVETLHGRESDRRYVRAVTAEARLTAGFLSLLPFVLMGVARAVNPDFMRPIFDTFWGNVVVVWVTLMVLAGNAVVKNMVSKTVGEA